VTTTAARREHHVRAGLDVEPHMVELPPGVFEMGATDDDKFASLLELPRRRVNVAAFAIGAYPVTAAQWSAYTAADPDAHRPPCAGPGLGDLPVAGISHRDARGYCNWLASVTGKPYRLPSEAEWEYACRAGTTGVFNTGSAITTEQANYMHDELGNVVGLGRPTPVGSYPPNAFGLYDMHGNVCEHVADHWYDGYHSLGNAPRRASRRASPRADEQAVVNRFRVIRGGAWDYMPRLLRCAYRDWIHEDRRLDNVGLRVALSVDAAGR
jgi:formylglycine-generating enzyme required for sulfatase activity